MELSLVGVDPCALLTGDQRARLGIDSVGTADIARPTDAPSCEYLRFSGQPNEGYSVGLYMQEAAEPALRSDGSRVVTAAGFGAVEARSPTGEPDRFCFMYVDVAEGQHLRLLYSYGSSQPPITRQIACEKARVAAELMVQNLVAQRR